MIPRRKFVKYGASATLGGFLIGLPAKFFGAISARTGLGSFSAETFIPLVNTNFKILHKGMRGYKIFRLVDVRKMNHRAKTLREFRGDTFSLLFQSEDSEQIEGRIYDVSHQSLGRFSAFISPVTPEPNLYEAIVSR